MYSDSSAVTGIHWSPHTLHTRGTMDTVKRRLLALVGIWYIYCTPDQQWHYWNDYTPLAIMGFYKAGEDRLEIPTACQSCEDTESTDDEVVYLGTQKPVQAENIFSEGDAHQRPVVYQGRIPGTCEASDDEDFTQVVTRQNRHDSHPGWKSDPCGKAEKVQLLVNIVEYPFKDPTLVDDIAILRFLYRTWPTMKDKLDTCGPARSTVRLQLELLNVRYLQRRPNGKWAYWYDFSENGIANIYCNIPDTASTTDNGPVESLPSTGCLANTVNAASTHALDTEKVNGVPRHPVNKASSYVLKLDDFRVDCTVLDKPAADQGHTGNSNGNNKEHGIHITKRNEPLDKNEQLHRCISLSGMAMPRYYDIGRLHLKLSETSNFFIIENETDTLHFSIDEQPHWWLSQAELQKLVGISTHSLGARYKPIDRGKTKPSRFKRMQKTQEAEGTTAAHDETGVPCVDNTKKNIDLPAGAGQWYVSQTTTLDFFAADAKIKHKYDVWQVLFVAWYDANPALTTPLIKTIHDKVPPAPAAEMISSIPATGISHTA